MGLEGLVIYLIIQAFIFGGSALVLFVLLFMTGRRVPDPRGVLLPAAFALSLTLAGILGSLGSVGALSAMLGSEATGAGDRCSGIVGTTRFGGSGSSVTTLAQQAPPPPREIFTPTPPEPLPPPDFDIDPPVFTPRRPGGPIDLPIRCSTESGRRVASVMPWLIVSVAAVGGGSRTFRRMLNEERYL